MNVRRHEHGSPQTVPTPFCIPQIAISECPVSLFTQRDIDLVQLVNTLTNIHNTTGSTIPVQDMPGHLVDAINVIRWESQSIELARDEALN